MLQPDEIFPFDEGEDPAELLRALPEIRDNVAPAPRDEELGLRSLLDWKEPMPPTWAHHVAWAAPEVHLAWDMPGIKQEDYTLPESLDEQKLTAELADGVLTVRIPRLPEAQPRKIQIGQGSTPKQLNQ